MGNILTAALLGALVLLFAVVTAEVGLGTVPKRDISGENLPPRDLGPAPEAVSVNVAALDALSETVERPLFLERRRPPEPEAEPEPERPVEKKAVASAPRFVLSAIVIADGERTALLRDPSDGRMARVIEGEDIQGWTLKEVQSDRIVLATEGRQQELPLRTFLPPPAAQRRRVEPRDDDQREAQQEERDATQAQDQAGNDGQRRRPRRRNRQFRREPQS